VKRPTFLTHFALTLALVAGGWFAWMKHVPQTIFANDASMMTSVILGLLVVTTAYLGWQAWKTDDLRPIRAFEREGVQVDSGFGHFAERLAVMSGFVGTAIGLSMQAVALAAGSQSFGALATSLYTTASGGVAAILIAIMTRNVERGVIRVRS
jgi:hypothetical protein